MTNEKENAAAETPEVSSLKELFNRQLNIRSIALTGIFILAVMYTFYFARALFIPLFFALLFNLMLSPAVDMLRKVHMPPAFGAAIVLSLLIAIFTLSFYVYYQPASEWMGRAPTTLKQIERKLRFIKEPVEKVSEATKSVEKITEMNAKESEKSVHVKEPPLLNTLFYQTYELVFGLATTVILLYFLLASGDLFVRKVINVLPTLKNKKQAVEIMRHINRDISTYLYTITLINICLGIVIGFAMHLLGMPNPFLWGVMAGVVNFIPYLGQAAGITVITFVALTTFDNVTHAILCPVVYFAIISLEGNFLTPMILGKRLMLNPVVIFLAIIFWGWIWGIPGALIAVPVVVIVKIICDRIESLAAVGELLGK